MLWLLRVYDDFGEPYAIDGMGGFMDRRAELRPARELWLDSELGHWIDRECVWDIWRAVDAHKVKAALEQHLARLEAQKDN